MDPGRFIERSGRPVGTISTYFRQNSLSGFRAMTKNPPKFTTINTTTMIVRLTTDREMDVLFECYIFEV